MILISGPKVRVSLNKNNTFSQKKPTVKAKRKSNLKAPVEISSTM